MRKHLSGIAMVIAITLAAGPSLAKKQRVCVEVMVRAPKAKGAPTSLPARREASHSARAHGHAREAPTAPAVDLLRTSRAALGERKIAPPRWTTSRFDLSKVPLGYTPADYLKRLLEHFVTHEAGFLAVKNRCQQRLRVELYPLREGWTAFARYTGYGREEWIEQLLPDEMSQFAERAVKSLLHDRSISTTIKRDTVLRADTRIPKRWIGGTHHFALSLGTQLRFGVLDSVQDGGGVDTELRVFSPMTLGVGYRGKFENWAIEAMASLGLAADRTAARSNSRGGHVDMGGNTSVSVHFLRYFDPRGVTSFYLGAGGRFEVMWFSAIRPEGERGSDDRSAIASGGIDADLVFGWEFMRATRIQWVIQGEVHLPAYVINTENDYGRVKTWMPGASLSLGVLF